ncbi:hypothetical protein ATM17_12750 [Sphingopyxis macrogoltabida]|uniref:Putative phage metallopeptidase domain-containing protein n=2 Tax=Sphingopyxis macrogoltabida TaxID=33050 RepID=A0AAC8Z144_SPHMC|nr:hypothetical protein LH19_07080 [Sphingopyxis macrogoltabida]AMU89905.1 hypothetical protein ATM17_12750 [Sphingopyxis macrogoltabida]
MTRPYPPTHLVEPAFIDAPDRFEPDAELTSWIMDTFINGSGPLVNPEHVHLSDAHLGFLWTNSYNAKQMRVVLGQTEIMPPMAMGKWQRARAIQQIEEWFGGEMPDFLITFSAPACDGMNDASFCALVEHELYHCAQALDAFGMPKFNKAGQPIYAMRGHDVEEFVGVVRRYGAEAAGVQPMIDAANAKPLIAGAEIDGICGTCALKAA